MKNWKNVLVYSTPLLLAPLAFAASCTNKDDGKKDAKIAELTKQYEEISKQLNTLKSELDEAKKAKAEETKKLEEAIQKLESVKDEINKNIPEYYPTKQILTLKDKVDNDLQAKGLLYLLAPNQEQSDAIVKTLEEAIKEIDKIDQSKLTADGLAWLNGIKYNWEIEIGNHKNGLRYLLGSFNWGPSSTYVANSFYGTIVPRNFSDPTATQWLATLKEAVAKNIVPSKIFIKNNIQYIIKKKFAKDLQEFLKGTETEITVKKLIEDNKTYSQAVKDFYLYYVDTYYKASSYGKGEDIAELKLTKANTLNELENTIELKAGKVYGLGLTQRDLDQKEAGLGYIPGTPGELTGKEIYAQISKMNTTTSLTPAEVYAKGMNTSLTAATNMSKVAEEAAKLIAGTNTDWSSTIMYDADGPDGVNAQSETLEIKKDGVINLENFNKWLNAEDFFFGREKATLYSTYYKQSLDGDTSLDFARAELTKFGYDHLKGDNTLYNSITNDQFYYGALEAFKAYKQFKDTTQKYGSTFFAKAVPDYDIQTYKYEDRAYEGVGAYDSGVMKFMFNADPYYSLPKWSVTSFANHESMMGHHNQIMYAQRYLSEVLGMKLGNVFDYTSYVEGWALFMEWFGIEAGFYGTPNYADTTNYYSMPTSFDLAKGITNFFTTTEDAKITAEQISQIKNLHGGVYWEKVNEKELYTADEKAHAKAAVKLANMLQYYGALNEAQLRNMRLAVDSIYHAPDIAGQAELPKGASILQARAFMKKNSALGLGDIQSESKRYFNCVGQAISYNSGKEVMLDLYKAVHTKLGYTRQQFVEEHKDEIQKFFDWLLRNGALPVETLRLTIKKAYNID